jgi:outer membrane protein
MRNCLSSAAARIIIFALPAFIYLNRASAQEKITLQQAIDSTISRNIEVKQAEFDADISSENLNLSKAAVYPTLNGGIATYRLFGRSLDPTTNTFTNSAVNLAQGNLYADVTIFQGFEKVNQIKQNKAFLDADKDNVNKIKNDLTLSVLTTYLQVLTNRDLLKASKQQLEIAQEMEKSQEKFYNVKQKTLADLSQAKAQVSNAEANVVNAQNEVERSYLFLGQLMERNEDDHFVVVDPPEDQIEKLNLRYTAIDVYLRALETNPDVLMAAHKREGYEKGIAVARSQGMPSLSFGAGLSTSYSSNLQSVVTTSITGSVPIGVVANNGAEVLTPTYLDQNVSFRNQLSENFNQAIGFTLVIPIVNGFTSRIEVRKAKLQYQSALAAEDLAKTNINKVIAEAVWDVHATQKKYESAIVTFKSANDAFKVIQQRYSVGLVNSLDLNVAQTQRNLAEFALIQSKYDLIFKSKLIDYYLGNPISFN